MSDFFSVIDEFSHLIDQYNFKSPKKLWYSHLVALSKHLDDIFYCYIIARVHKHDGSLETTLWVGPIDRPDDGLENLSANIKLQIGYSQIPNINFFRECEKKIINIIQSGVLNSLVATSKIEIETPSVKNARYEVYTQYILPFFQMVQNESDDKKILNNKKKCRFIIEKTFYAIDGNMKLFFEKLGIGTTIDMIWELCYIY
jgi:hypothetical protein